MSLDTGAKIGGAVADMDSFYYGHMNSQCPFFGGIILESLLASVAKNKAAGCTNGLENNHNQFNTDKFRPIGKCLGLESCDLLSRITIPEALDKKKCIHSRES